MRCSIDSLLWVSIENESTFIDFTQASTSEHVSQIKMPVQSRPALLCPACDVFIASYCLLFAMLLVVKLVLMMKVCVSTCAVVCVRQYRCACPGREATQITTDRSLWPELIPINPSRLMGDEQTNKRASTRPNGLVSFTRCWQQTNNSTWVGSADGPRTPEMANATAICEVMTTTLPDTHTYTWPLTHS